jgi:hypothetical protein
MSIITTMRGKKKHITSSYFKDISVMRASEIDSNYRQMHRDRSGLDIPKLKLAYVIQKIKLWRQGCQELSDYIAKLSNHEIENVVADYVGEDYEEYTEDIPQEKWYKKDTDIRPVYKTSGDL